MFPWYTLAPVDLKSEDSPAAIVVFHKQVYLIQGKCFSPDSWIIYIDCWVFFCVPKEDPIVPHFLGVKMRAQWSREPSGFQLSTFRVVLPSLMAVKRKDTKSLEELKIKLTSGSEQIHAIPKVRTPPGRQASWLAHVLLVILNSKSSGKNLNIPPEAEAVCFRKYFAHDHCLGLQPADWKPPHCTAPRGCIGTCFLPQHWP